MNHLLENSEVLNNEELLRYLGYGREEYEKEFDYAEGDTPDERIDELLKKQENREARKKMVHNIVDFDKALTELEANGEAFTQPFDEVLRNLAYQIAYDAAMDLKDEEERTKTLKFLAKITEPPWLFAHLDETGESIDALFTNARRNGREQILEPRKQILMKFVALTHDLGKLMGSMNAQIDPDHEVFYRKIIGKHLEGKSFGGIIFDEKDVEFITAVAGFHEDIFREEEFAYQATALVKTNVITPEIEVARARTLFHFTDIFGNAVRVEKGQLKIVNEGEFKKRFLDLFQRHIKLPILDASGVDWSPGKVTRPEWGKHGVAGLTWTFDILSSDWGIALDPNLKAAVINGIEDILDKAEMAILGVNENNPDYKLKLGKDDDPALIRTFLDDALIRIQKAKEDIRKEYE